MARSRIKLDGRGFDQIAKSREVTAVVQDAAESVADIVKSQGIMVDGIPGDIELPVTVSMSETDRAHATVALAHPSGDAVQAKHGALTKAATQAGLEVRARF